MNRSLLLLITLDLSVGLLVYLLRSVDLSDVIRHVVEGDHWLFGVAVVIYATVVVLSTVRWKVLLDALGATPFATDRNPWFVALNLVAGTPVRAPREVREAAAELAERMRPPAKTAPERSKRRHAGASPGRRT